MHVLGCQFDIAWENKPANHATVRRLLERARPKPATLVVLPEMFATGFTMAVVEDTGDFVSQLARDYRVQILAGIVRNRRNEAVLFDVEGREVVAYAKMHPFTFAGEKALPGTQPVVVDCSKFKLAPTVCYDLRFPELYRAGVRQGAQLFAVIANWPAPRAEHWATLLRARAIENQAYVIGVNRIGRDPQNDYAGQSLIVGPRGEVLAEAGNAECTISAELKLPELLAYRKEFPVLSDMR